MNIENLNKELLLKCIEIAYTNIPNSRYNVFAEAMDIYNFIQKGDINISGTYFKPDTHEYAFDFGVSTTFSKLIDEYIHLKSKELSCERVNPQNSTDNSYPLNPSIKVKKSFLSRFFSKFRCK